MKRRSNNDGKFMGTPLGKLVAGTQIIKVNATLNVVAGPAGGEIHVCYTIHVFVNYN